MATLPAGNPVLLANTGGSYSSGLMAFAGPFTTTEAGTATKMWIYTDLFDFAVTMGIYEDDAGEPGALLAETAGGAIGGSGTPAWKSQNITASLADATDYWLGIQWDNGTALSQITYETATGDGGYAAHTYDDGDMPDPAPVITVLNQIFGIYVEYTPSGSESPLVSESETVTVSEAVTVALPPGLASVTPSSAYANPTTSVTLTGVALTGTALNGGSPTMNVPGGWSANTYNASSATAATFNMVIPAAAAHGTYQISLTTAGGTTNQLNFTITNPAAGSASPGVFKSVIIS